MKYWDTFKENPELGDNVIMIKKDVHGLDVSCGYRKTGSKVEILESVVSEIEWIFEIEDMVYGLRCAIRNFEYNNLNVVPRATSEQEVGLMEEAIKWLEEE